MRSKGDCEYTKQFEKQLANLKEELQTRNNVNGENELSNALHINNQLKKEIVNQQEVIKNTEIAINAQLGDVQK